MALLEQIEVKDYNAIADALSQELALAAVERDLRALATKVGLDITNRIFEVMGTRSTATKYGFDRKRARSANLHATRFSRLQATGYRELVAQS